MAIANSILCSGRSRISRGGGANSQWCANLLFCKLFAKNQWRIQDFAQVGRQPSNGAPTYDFAKYSQKLHEIERIWTPGRATKILLCRSATENCMKMKEFGSRGDSPRSVTALFFNERKLSSSFLASGAILDNFTVLLFE